MKNDPRHLPRGAVARRLALLVSCLSVLAPLPADAQLARKPSFYDAQKRVEEPASPVRPAGGASSLPALASRADFDALARTYDAGTPMALPHVLFVIDRRAKPAPRVYYLDTPRWQLHVRFVRDTGLAPHAGKREIDRNYLVPDRRFLFGTLSWQQNVAGFGYEFWEGDRLTAPLLREADRAVKASFFAPVKFKTNSTLHERVAREAGVDFVTQEALIREQPYLPMNSARPAAGCASSRTRVRSTRCCPRTSRCCARCRSRCRRWRAC